MDLTAIGIVIGLGMCGTYAAVRAVRQQSFDIGSTITVFLAGFALPAGTKLIAAGVRGEPAALPSSWREYVAVAGVAGIGLAAHFLILEFRSAWVQRADPKTAAAMDTPDTT